MDETDNASLNQSLVAEPLPYNVLFPEQDLRLWVSFDPKDIIVTVSQGFTPHVVKQETVIIREPQNYWYLHLAHISRPIPTKKHRLKIRLVPCENKALCWSDNRRPEVSINVIR